MGLESHGTCVNPGSLEACASSCTTCESSEQLRPDFKYHQYLKQHQKLTAFCCLGFPWLQVCRHYNQSDLARLRHQLMVLPGEVDLLLTCEWPTGVLQQLPAGQDNLPGEPILWFWHAVLPASMGLLVLQ